MSEKRYRIVTEEMLDLVRQFFTSDEEFSAFLDDLFELAKISAEIRFRMLYPFKSLKEKEHMQTTLVFVFSELVREHIELVRQLMSIEGPKTVSEEEAKRFMDSLEGSHDFRTMFERENYEEIDVADDIADEEDEDD